MRHFKIPSVWAWAVICGLCLLPALLRAESAPGIRVIEETAIPYTRFLSKADFDQRYPGELLPDTARLDAGWYVIYAHQSLSYYFGPILLESTGEDYLAQLKATVGAAVAQRPSIEGYRLELSYEPQVAPSTSASPAQSAEAPSPRVGSPQSAPPPSLFEWVLRLFGFGR